MTKDDATGSQYVIQVFAPPHAMFAVSTVWCAVIRDDRGFTFVHRPKESD